MKLKDKVAIVTGGARGIGEAIARRYADEGARVIIADILKAEAEETAKSIGRGAFAIHLDVTKRDSIDAMVKETVAKAGKIDILVNGAAIFDMSPFMEITESSFDKQFAINVKGLLFTLQTVAGQMIAQGTRGKIINFASQAGRRGEGLVAVYCATKAAVISITQSAGLALIKQGINVNAIAPGVVETPMWETVDELFGKYTGRAKGETKKMVGELVPYGRFGKPEEMAGCAVFLASDDAEYIVAQTFGVDGGNWMA